MSAPDSTGSSTRALRGASLLILLQVVSRAVTFVANQVLLRFLTAQLLGVSTQLEVYYLSVIFFARESLRVAIQRQDSSGTQDKDKDKNGQANSSAQAVVNLGYLATGLGIPLSVLLGWLYLHSVSATTLATAPNLVVSLYIYGLAAVVELVSEPAFVVMQTRLQFGTRAAAESVATFLRCAVTLGTAVWASNRDLGVLPFALGQLSYGIGLLAVYAWHGTGLARREGFSLLPRRITDSRPHDSGEQKRRSIGEPTFALSYFYRPTLNLASSMMAQSVVKHVLTQGDTFLVSILSTPTAQGVYALANNYGGLLARLVFQPIEESSRSYFSRLLAPSSASTATTATTTTKPSFNSDSPPSSESPLKTTTQPPPPELTPALTALTALTSLLKSYLLLSLLITTLGPPASAPLLTLIAGPRWTSSGAPSTLATYMWYIPLLALNGILEAFVSSVATREEVHAQSAWMGVFSAVFAAAGYVFLRVLGWGAEGLVLANGVNMACRIVWCARFIRRYFARRGEGREGVRFEVGSVLPSAGSVLAAAAAGPSVRRVVAGGTAGVKEAVVELVKVAGVAVPFVLVIAVSERRFIYSAVETLRGRRQASS